RESKARQQKSLWKRQSPHALLAVVARRCGGVLPARDVVGTPQERALIFTTRPELLGTFGAVATTHWLASAPAMSILERGGNAFDAAVTAGFVLQVVEPHLNGPGGDVPILLWSAKRGRVEAICGQGVAPAAATIEHFRSLGLDIIPGTGLLPAV